MRTCVSVGGRGEGRTARPDTPDNIQMVQPFDVIPCCFFIEIRFKTQNPQKGVDAKSLLLPRDWSTIDSRVNGI